MSDNIMQESKTCFWQEIQNNTITIPQIQRDYAQGRVESNVVEIRNRILNNLHSAIKFTKSIDLDFVYGYKSDNKFIPLDGQQRLTTLFLIHWYLAKRTNDAEISKLEKFRYETRQSSTDFCRAILKEEIVFVSDDLKDWILDQQWFFHSWLKDPTINGMLTMIQAIHLKFKDEDYAQLWINLIQHSPITFNFLPIENFGLNDELYIKMNSRGKPLTRFENFKVWFEKKYPQNKEWQNKIDNEWTNLFWQYKSNNDSVSTTHRTMDDDFMRFLNGMVMFGLAQKGHKNDVLFFANNSEISLTKYEEKDLDIYSLNEVNKITRTLDWMVKHNSLMKETLKEINLWQEKSIFETFISDKLTYTERIRFYAIVFFVTKMDETDYDGIHLVQWIRVTRNLIENSVINSPETFIGAINAIDTISSNCLNIYDFLQNPENKVLFFLTSQIEEERLKVSLIKQDSNWETAFIKAENHELFRGNVGFLLLDKSETTLAKFKIESNTASSLFDKNGSIAEYKADYLLIRSTLAQSLISGNIKLLDNGENWRALLKRKDIQLGISKIISEIGLASAGYLSYLENIIKDFISKEILWKFQVIRNKILLGSDTSRFKFVKQYEEGYYLFNNENGNWINNDNQILLSNYRNELIDLVLNYSQEIQLNISNNWVVIKDSVTSKRFYRGYIILLNKNFGNYNLTLEFTSKKLIIGFRNEVKHMLETTETMNTPVQNYILSRVFEIPKTEEELIMCFENIKTELPLIEKMVTSKQVTT